MNLSQREWRSYLDDILDEHMRTHVTVDAWQYISEGVEWVFNECLRPLPEYSSTNFFAPSEPLDVLLSHRDTQQLLAQAYPDGDGNQIPSLLVDKWKASKEVGIYLRDVIAGQKRKRTLRSESVWLEEEEAKTTFMERPVLTRQAMKETPLRKAPSTESATKENTRTNANKQFIKARFLPGILGSAVQKVEVEEEEMSQKDLERLIVPRIVVPRSDAKAVVECIRSTPFAPKTMNPSAASADSRVVLPSEKYSRLVDFEPLADQGKRVRPMSPPLFARASGTRGKSNILDSKEGMVVLKEHFVKADMPMELDEDMTKENMKIIDGWVMPPLDLSTPSLTPDHSGKEHDTTIEIEELMFPSSPPVKSKDLKSLFISRMDDILLPKAERLELSRGKTERVGFKSLEGETLQSTLSGALRLEHLPMAPEDALITPPRISGGIPKELLPYAPSVMQSIIGVASSASDEGTSFFGKEMTALLDDLGKEAAGVGLHDFISRDSIGDTRLMQVPSLEEPYHMVKAEQRMPRELQELSMPFLLMDHSESSEATNSFLAFDSAIRPTSNPLIFLIPAKGMASLQLELSWQPFVYQGPLISHETVTGVHESPFVISSTPGSSKGSSMDEEVEDVRCQTKEYLRKWTADQISQGEFEDWAMKLIISMEDGASGKYTWMSDRELLLTREEKRRPRAINEGRDGMSLAADSSLAHDEEALTDKPKSLIVDANFIDTQGEVDIFDNEELILDDFDFSPTTQSLNPQPRSYVPQTPLTDHDEYVQTDSGSSRYPDAPVISMTFDGRPTGREQFPTNRLSTVSVPRVDLSPGPSSGPVVNGPESITTSSSTQPISGPVARIPNVSMLKTFLEQRGIPVQLDAQSASLSNTERSEGNISMDDDTSSPAYNVTELTFPTDLLSQRIVRPNSWNAPLSKHHYLASLSLLQRRALAQCLQERCNVQLTELVDLGGSDLIIDSHSAVITITISDVVPSNLNNLSASIVELAYRFSRILVILEAFPISRSNHSLDRLRQDGNDGMRMVTETVLSTVKRLKRNYTMAIGLIGVNEEMEGKDDEVNIGEVEVELVFAKTVEESAQFIRVFGDYAEAAVSESERDTLWRAREWLDNLEHEDSAILISRFRGMNLFTAMAIASVTSLESFVRLELESKLHQFGALVGPFRMALFHSLYRDTLVRAETNGEKY